MSLRDQKNLAIRRAIQNAALELFESSGFREVTISEIAEKARCSKTSVYRLFQSKEQLILWDEVDSTIERHLTKILGKVPPFDALHQAFLDAYADLPEPSLRLLARRSRLINSVPEVLGVMAAGLEADRKELQEALFAAYPNPPLELDLITRFALAALVAGIDTWLENGAGDDILTCIDQTFKTARNALA